VNIINKSNETDYFIHNIEFINVIRNVWETAG